MLSCVCVCGMRLRINFIVRTNEVLEACLFQLQPTAKSTAEKTNDFCLLWGCCCFFHFVLALKIWHPDLGLKNRCFWNWFCGITIQSTIQDLQTALMTHFSDWVVMSWLDLLLLYQQQRCTSCWQQKQPNMSQYI